MKKGFDILRDKHLNRGIATSRTERVRLGLQGLLPHRVWSEARLVDRVMTNLRRLPRDIDRYMLLSGLQERNERLFYRTLIDHIEEVMPWIYTPTVGEACREFSHIAREPKGFFITPDDRGRIRRMLGNWPDKDIRVIVVTDGQRILGLGDLGANGMGIPIGKLALYTACAGIPPEACLPVTLDVGTDTVSLLEDPLYLGYPRRRIKSRRYFALVDEFVDAVRSRYPDALLQFEDFLTPNAYALLKRYRDRLLCFNDDIQGTAAVVLAGVLASTRVTRRRFEDLTILFLGAGSAATGIADLMVAAFVDAGLAPEEARRRLWFVDVKGLVVAGRDDLLEHNRPYAHAHPPLGFLEAIDALKPQVLIGATGSPGTFTREAIERMARHNEQPLVFALSNPTSKAECTAAQAYEWSGGRAVFASGSPFLPVELGGKTRRPGQGNNAYVFPGIGLGAIFCKAKGLPDELFLAAARTLADLVRPRDLEAGSLYPPLRDIRRISRSIAAAVAAQAWSMGLARARRPRDLRRALASFMYEP
ncbi:MAG TPA: NAD-dependent malic enzyme [Candidatus Polarisedimenticolia bacterium]|jgi:malate dehydrogenase (oxaloacetate-decarboxylating)(NADP+)|nr:NAD-dependent malic enzyme [Candidatus Polarisedimenticolia bacterium]